MEETPTPAAESGSAPKEVTEGEFKQEVDRFAINQAEINLVGMFREFNVFIEQDAGKLYRLCAGDDGEKEMISLLNQISMERCEFPHILGFLLIVGAPALSEVQKMGVKKNIRGLYETIIKDVTYNKTVRSIQQNEFERPDKRKDIVPNRTPGATNYRILKEIIDVFQETLNPAAPASTQSPTDGGSAESPPPLRVDSLPPTG